MQANPTLDQGALARGLVTPTALLDPGRVQGNIDRMQRHLESLGVALRPHVKTAKCLAVAERQRAAGARGITVSTLKEAATFFDAGFDDILYAVGIAPGKLEPVRQLRQRGCALKVIVDSIEAAAAVAEASRGAPRLEAWIEIDVDGQRAGVRADSEVLIGVGRTLHEGGALLGGVLTHGGSSYHLRGLEAIGRFAEQERALTVAAAERLRGAGLPCPVVSVGSTPTAIAARALPGVTEVRAGVYVFHDLVMHGLGVCALDEIALTVLATVIGHQADKGWVLIDAGWMALSRDRGTADHAVDQGFGLVCDEAGQPVDGGAWIVSATNQEHGTVTRRGSALAGADLRRRFPIGSRWRVLPIHACATAAQFDRYHLLGGASEGEVWPRFGGW